MIWKWFLSHDDVMRIALHDGGYALTVECASSLKYINDLLQDCSNSIANTLELLQSCAKPSIYCATVPQYNVPQRSVLTTSCHADQCYGVIHPIKYAYRLAFLFDLYHNFYVEACHAFTHILLSYFVGTGSMIQLSQYSSSKPERFGKFNWYQLEQNTTTHSPWLDVVMDIISTSIVSFP